LQLCAVDLYGKIGILLAQDETRPARPERNRAAKLLLVPVERRLAAKRKLNEFWLSRADRPES
jgi:hypothetical protein